MTLPGRRGWPAIAVLLSLALQGCGQQGDQSAAPQQSAPAFTILAGSELRDVEPALVKAAAEAGVSVKVSYAGTLDIVERVNAGEPVDAILPPNGAYPALALAVKPLAREKLFYSRVALGVKPAKLKQLGWDRVTPSWADIARAAGEGKLRYAMTNPTSSNTGMSALFAVASSVAGKTEDLNVQEVSASVLKAFLSGQKLTAGSSGWLSEAFVKNPAALDAMVNYEAVLLRANGELAAADKLTLLYPQDGVISADYPLMLLNAAKRGEFDKLVLALKSVAFQTQATNTAFLRPAVPGVAVSPSLSPQAVAELSFPNNLEVIDTVLSAYQGEWRRPATSIFVLDVSGSMDGERLEALKTALKTLAGADARSASARYARFQTREHVLLLAFSGTPRKPMRVNFDTQSLPASRAQVITYADGLEADGGTAIYDALLAADSLAALERGRDADRFISIVLLTDGRNNEGAGFDEFRARLAAGPTTPVFPILFGEASSDDMKLLAQLTGGRVFDGRKASLALVFKEIRGYQ